VAANTEYNDHDETRPWEQPGAGRRDYEPHRGRLLLALGGTALAGGGLAAGLTFTAEAFVGFSESPLFHGRAPGLWFLAGVACWLALVATAAGVPAWLMAREEVGRMRQGCVDPAGLRAAGRAASWSRVGVALGVAVFALWLVVNLGRVL
jgi:hypothetical protein